jgi:RNA polymerase sigma-70 factor (ECF subfamily)
LKPSAEILYQEHRQTVYRLCLRYGGGRIAWAEDATQDTFIKLIEALPSLKEQENLGPWIRRVAANACLTRLKREGSVWQRVSSALRAGGKTENRQTPEKRVAVQQDLQRVFDQLDLLPAKERMVFSMRYLDEMTQQDIADALSLSKGYVSKLLSRTNQRLDANGAGGEQ